MTECKCLERATGKPRPPGVDAHTLGCLMNAPDLQLVTPTPARTRDADETKEPDRG